MPTGEHEPKHEYTMSRKKLIPVTEERDLGVIISDDLKRSKQCNDAARKGNRMLGLISRTIPNKSKYSILKLYNAFVRPHLEYSVQF